MKQSVTTGYKVIFLAFLCALGLVAGVVHFIRSMPGSDVIIVNILLFSSGMYFSVVVCGVSMMYLIRIVLATNISKLRWTAELMLSLGLIVLSGYTALTLHGKYPEMEQMEKKFKICEQRNLTPEACDRALLKLQKENSA